jgi:hypothetical protein
VEGQKGDAFGPGFRASHRAGSRLGRCRGFNPYRRRTVMATITTKFSVGDTVWHAGTTTDRKQHDCPDCLNTRKWQGASPAGSEYSFACPRCSTRYSSFDDLRLDYTAHVPFVSKRTIGSVRVDTHPGSWGDQEPHSYMCAETGVGSGAVYRESDLFATEEEALKAAEAKAALANANSEWIVKLYNKSLEISDYQLENAALKAAKDEAARARSMLWNLHNLFATISEAGDKDAILEAVEDYKNFDWKNDLAEAAQGIETRQGEDPQELRAKPESPVAASDAPTPSPPSSHSIAIGEQG